MGVNWTDEQLAAITTTDRGVVVPAAAGSGKTAVLIERTVRLLENTDPVKGCPAEKLLAVTFTKQAAAQMKRKLRRALSDRIISIGDSDIKLRNWLERQQEMLELANISTIDSFCLEIVKSNLDEFDYRSGIKIADETEAKAITDEALKRTIEEMRSNTPEKAELLTDALTNNSDAALEAGIRDFCVFIRSLAFPQKWIDDRLKELPTTAYADSCAVKMMEQLRPYVDKALKLEEQAEAVALRLHDKYMKLICDDRECILDILKALDNGSWEQLFDAVSGIKFARLSPLSVKGMSMEDAAFLKMQYEQFKQLRDDMKTAVKSIAAPISEIGRDIYEPMQTAAFIFSALVDAWKLLEKYSAEIKTERGVADFGDIARMALELLVKQQDGVITRTPIAQQLVDDDVYHVLLIDEFQDVNNLQETIFRALSKTDDLSVLGSNVFVVGDLKQSIYRFRQSNPALFENAIKAAKKPENTQLTEIRLTSNFRSRAVVIDLVNAIFTTLMSREMGEVDYNDDEKLRCGASYGGSDQPCEFMLIEEPEEGEPREFKYLKFGMEELAVASRIKTMLDEGTPVYEGEESRPAKPSDFCVLTRSNTACSQISEALRYVGLKVKSEQSKGYMGSREIMTMISLLRVIDDPLKDTEMAAVMLSPVMGFTADELARLRIRGREVLAEEGKTNEKNMKLRLVMKRAAKEGATDKKESSYIDLHDENLQKKCRLADALLEQLKFYAVSLPLDVLITKIYDETGFFAAASAYEDPKQRRANLRLLTQHAAAFEKNNMGGIPGFLNYLDKISAAKGDFEQAVTTTGGEDSVAVMTHHRSKGLEFPFVFCAKLNSSFNTSDLTDKVLLSEYNGAGINYLRHDKLMKVKTVGHKVLEYSTLAEQLSEEMRLLYVALTRAKERLIIPIYLTEKAGKVGNIKNKLLSLAVKISSAGGVNSRILSECRTPAEWICAFIMQSEFNLPLLKALGRDDLAADLAALAKYPAGQRPSVVWITPDMPDIRLQSEISQSFRSHQPQPQTVEMLREKYLREYPGESRAAASKRTVTEIVAEMRREESGDEKSDHSFFPQLGSLTEEAGRLTAAQRGTFTHLFMELADYDLAEKDVKTELERLVTTGRLSRQEADGVYINALERFFAGSFYRRMKASDELRREMKFMVSAEDAGLDEKFGKYIDPTGMLQGVCDCIFREPDGYVLVDYKTDGFTDISQLDTYHIQLELYRSALDIILPQPVKACYIYSFKLAQGKEIAL